MSGKIGVRWVHPYGTRWNLVPCAQPNKIIGLVAFHGKSNKFRTIPGETTYEFDSFTKAKAWVEEQLGIKPDRTAEQANFVQVYDPIREQLEGVLTTTCSECEKIKALETTHSRLDKLLIEAEAEFKKYQNTIKELEATNKHLKQQLGCQGDCLTGYGEELPCRNYDVCKEPQAIIDRYPKIEELNAKLLITNQKLEADNDRFRVCLDECPYRKCEDQEDRSKCKAYMEAKP